MKEILALLDTAAANVVTFDRLSADLAQASMAGAADKLDSLMPVLTSPKSGFEAAVGIFRNTP